MHRTVQIVEMGPSRYRSMHRIFAIHRSFGSLRMFAAPQCLLSGEVRGATGSTNGARNIWKQHPPLSVISASSSCVRIQCFSDTTTNTMSDDEMQRRLSVFQDLFVVARDGMKDLLTLIDAIQESDDDDDDDDDYDASTNEALMQHVAIVQNSVNAAKKEFEALIYDLRENPEQRNRFIQKYGLILKQLELEIAMLLQDTNDKENNDESIDNNSEDDEDDLEVEEDEDDDDDLEDDDNDYDDLEDEDEDDDADNNNKLK
jgi:hypothetical protein